MNKSTLTKICKNKNLGVSSSFRTRGRGFKLSKGGNI